MTNFQIINEMCNKIIYFKIDIHNDMYKFMSAFYQKM